MTIPMPDELRDAIGALRDSLGVHSDSAAVRSVVAEACRKRGIRVPADVIGPPPGPRRKVAQKGGKPARKPKR